MRLLVVLGLILAALGVVALVVPAFTFFTTERLTNVGYFTIDVGVIALTAGLVLAVVGLRSGSAR